ncbi:MAG: class I tRNA ligase family protein, partial [Phycisphaerales bacterium]|nr:class I tRNA ligase family protein [Phycisphaerales bacterium]
LVAVDMVDEQPDGTFLERATGQRVKQIVAKMSKSLKNVVNPDDIIRDYGADTFRLYEMYMGPLEASKPWNTKDIIGPHRFLQRLWRNVIDEETGAVHITDAPAGPEMNKLLHRTIAGVTADIDNIALHTAIAKLIELNNALTRHVAEAPAPRAVIEPMLILLSPFCPHIAEELWQRIGPSISAGQRPGITDQPWPTFDPSLLVDDSVEIAVQVLGKVRGKLIVPTKADAKAIEALALADPGVQAHLAGKAVKKCIVVPGRLVNFVV